MRKLNRRRALAVGLVVVAAAGNSFRAPTLRVDAANGRQGGSSPTSSTSAISGVTYSLLSTAEASQPSVSGAGERVVFVAAPGTADSRIRSVWMEDRGTHELTELSLPNPNVRAGDSVDPVISADGCVVVMTTEISYDLFRDDDLGNRWDVYRMTLPACGGALNDWTLVSTRLNDEGVAEARGDVIPAQPATVSASGTVIAYVHPMAVREEVDRALQLPNAIEVVDLTVPVDDAKHTATAPGLPIDLAPAPAQYVGESAPVLTTDGNIVVFTSDANSDMAVPEWRVPLIDGGAAPTEIYAWDRSDADPFNAVKLISSGASGAADAPAISAAVSGDGRFIAFSSAAANLVASAELEACSGSCPAQIYVVDRDSDNNRVFDEADTITLSIASAVYSADADGKIDPSSFTIGNAPSFSPSISSDGNTLAFASQASNLLEIQTPGGGDTGDGDVIIADLTTHQLRRSFDIPSPTPGAYSHPHLSANSRVLVADSLVADRLLGDPTLTGRHIVAAAWVPSVSMADLDLGTVLVKVLGPEWYVNVTNTGPGSFVPATITSDNPDFAITGGTCRDLAAVSAGQSCSVTVTLTPSTAGPLSSTLTVAEAGFGAITLVANLTGSGGEPALLAKPSAKEFGTTVVGETSADTADFDVFNIYFSPIAVTSVTIDGANAGDFTADASKCLAATAILTTVVETPVPVTTPPATVAPTTVTPTTAAAPPTQPTSAAPTDPASGSDATPPSDGSTAPPATEAPTTASATTTPVSTPAPTTTPATALPTNEVTTKVVTEVVPGVAMNTSCRVSVTFTPTGAGIRTASVNIGSSVDQYTSMLISGVGVYSPTLVAPPTATPGRDVVIGGSGYPANTPVVIAWSDGSGRPLQVETDVHGKFVATFSLGLSQRPGPTTLVAQVAGGPAASISIDVDRLRRRSNGPRG
jgi:WD40-like Beta Propeller Repeat